METGLDSVINATATHRADFSMMARLQRQQGLKGSSLIKLIDKMRFFVIGNIKDELFVPEQFEYPADYRGEATMMISYLQKMLIVYIVCQNEIAISPVV